MIPKRLASAVRAVLALVLVITVGAPYFAHGTATAQTGTVHTIIVPDEDGDGDVGVTGGANGDEIIFTGKFTRSVDAGGCAQTAGLFPEQNAMAVDRASGSTNRPSRLLEVVLVSSATPLGPGTRLKNLDVSSACTGAAGLKYVRITGVEY